MSGASSAAVRVPRSSEGGIAPSDRARARRWSVWLLASLLLAGCEPDGPEPLDLASWTPRTDGEGWPDEAGPALEIPDALAGLDWLEDVSGYGADGLSDGRGSAGSFGLGNGDVFALVGLDEPWNTITNPIGPGYQRDVGFFGDSSVGLLGADGQLPFERERVQRPGRTAVVRTSGEAGDLVLQTNDVALVDQPEILRLVTLRNDGADSATAGFVLRLARSTDEVPPDDPLGLVQVRGPRTLRVRCDGATVGPDTLTIEPETLESGGQRSVACHYLFTLGGDPAPTPTGAPAAEFQAAADAMASRLSGAMEFEGTDPKVADLVEGMLVTELVQTDRSGVVSPMNRYTSGWLRDLDGPVRLLLRAGLHDEVRAMLDGVYEAMVVRQQISNSFGLDVDTSGFSEPNDPDTFWRAVDFMPGRVPAEAPSYVVLHHAEYVARSGDRSILSGGRMAYLDACVGRQEVNDEGLMAFSGDETFRLAMAVSLGGNPEDIGWSANSGFLLGAAGRALEALGGGGDAVALAETVRDATEARYWVEPGGYYSPLVRYEDGEPVLAPHEDVSTQPLWTGFASRDDDRQARNVSAMALRLMRADGSLLSPVLSTGQPNFAYTGMVPGYWLTSVAAVHDDAEALAFDAVDLTATPSGHFDEGHLADHSAIQGPHSPDGLGADAPARYRPWEGGDVAAAVLDYLFGERWDSNGELALAPHLPEGWSSWSARGLRGPDGRYDVHVEGFDEGLRVVIERDEGGSAWPLSLELHGDRPIARLAVDGVEREDLPGGPIVVLELELAPGDSIEVLAAF